MNKNSIEFKLIQSRLRETIEYSNYTLQEISIRTNISLSTLKG